ncbi:MAG: hypothetical protein E6K96_09595 [Thaumarchaeota archaeon]|nr:MAG: hypothetical protein E6K96_09595 [Nitrososphaerota archaeon]
MATTQVQVRIPGELVKEIDSWISEGRFASRSEAIKTIVALYDAFLVGNMKQTVSMLVESTGLSFKTVQKVLLRLSGKGLVAPKGKIGNAQAYQFSVENELHDLIEWASKHHFAGRS